MPIYFTGSKSKPSFLIDISKNISIYTPDEYSKNENFFEKYYLGKNILETKYDIVLFTKDIIKYKKYYNYTPELIIKIKNKYLLICDTIKKIDIL